MLKGCNGSLARRHERLRLSRLADALLSVSGSPRPSNGLRLRTATRAARACVAAVLRGALRHRGAQQLLHALPAPRALGGALGPVLIQLPSTFHLRLDRLDGLLRALSRRPHVRWVLEVRHASWLVDEVVERLARANVALCLHDWREQPVTGPLTADFVYVRRHGTRRRYGGSYTEAMLREDAARISGWTRGGRDVYVYFNNDGRAAAVRNARRLTELLEARAGRRRAA